MSLARSAANKLDWAKVIASLKLTGKTAAQLTQFKKRNDEARRRLFELESQPAEVDFAHYRAVLKNTAVVDQIEASCRAYRPVTVDVSKQISSLEAFEAQAVRDAQETEAVVGRELKALKETLANIEAARPFDELTVDELAAARPEIDTKVAEMVKRGKWEVPGYKEKFGDLTVM
ncbi:ACL097Cp [Eremothecium gossypii ATCC 10895]|uniref:ATP synthase subunit d, mitochondrial n=1 Tax=Eremothecium gossypii (strain ATCC 10895 / CBS 109.51 / FGSC 9923 / NRRL Y-1056) TaxID=284811 RepID=Q75CL6_EREGS|nr:ACL097Cp [Eremothecium gossypii ATCC 10895]AAS51131.1 ACL097Cp [Eremothecium gossypii ATCC 10895]AEY95421.1 FACL097Cp [Eremothecium gossypii FDAG1]